jgi:hypothetical protein
MDHAENLKNAEAAEGDQGNALVALFAPDGEGLRHKEGGIAQKTQTEDKCDDFPHPEPASKAGESLVSMIAETAAKVGA